MTDANTGKNLGKCLQVVFQAHEEIEAMISALSPFFEKKSSGDNKKKVWVNLSSESETKPKGFNDNFIASWELNGKEGHYLGFQISLLGIGMEIEGNDEPLLHLFKWNTGKVAPNLVDYYMYYPLNSEDGSELWSDSLIVWPDDEGNDYQWTFSLRLVALTNKAALEEHIIKPIEKLLKNPTRDDYEKDPRSSWDGLVRYNTDKYQLISIKAVGEK